MESLREDVGIHYRHAVEQDDSAGRFISVVFRCTNAYEKTITYCQ
ncbi:hypothetical protein AB6F62_08025 [Providencia huaxiensis]